MSGHSKWATIKHKKGAVDKARGKLFNKLARQLEVAARAGGGDPDANPTLRTAVQKAKAAQMTNDAIDRAIKRGTGEGDTGTYEAIMYEGYAPGGVALLIDVLTDNRNRTGAEIRGVFTRLGGSLAEPGSVSWQFGRRWRVLVDGAPTRTTLMLAALDAGADDVADDGGTWRVTTEASKVYDVKARWRKPASRSSRPTRRWCRTTSCRSRRSRRPRRCCASSSARGQRRRAGRLRQLRHRRRRDGRHDGNQLVSLGVGVGAPTSRCTIFWGGDPVRPSRHRRTELASGQRADRRRSRSGKHRDAGLGAFCSPSLLGRAFASGASPIGFPASLCDGDGVSVPHPLPTPPPPSQTYETQCELSVATRPEPPIATNRTGRR